MAGVHPPRSTNGRRIISAVFASRQAVKKSFNLRDADSLAIQTIGTFQAYLVTHQLSEYTEAEVGWIFGLYLFMAYCCGVQGGPIFDAIGPRHLNIVGSVCLAASMFLLEFCHRTCCKTNGYTSASIRRFSRF